MTGEFGMRDTQFSMTIPSAPEILFLHGGPGMTAELERRQFGGELPVLWWDQPLVRSGAAHPLNALVDAACVEIAHLSAERAGRIHLLANSFGAYLARALVDRVPDRIGAITICGGVWDLCTAILRLGLHFARSRCDADLETACRQAAEEDTPRGYFALFARVSALPGFLDCHWSRSAEEHKEAMNALAAAGRLMDWPTCQSVMIAALATPQSALPGPHHERVRIIIGRFDPCFDDGDIAAWQALWPGATVEVVDAGQFPHLELPPSVWLPRGRLEP
jgi:pimeloyl-ACP methyl ester carboxylesterase